MASATGPSPGEGLCDLTLPLKLPTRFPSKRTELRYGTSVSGQTTTPLYDALKLNS